MRPYSFPDARTKSCAIGAALAVLAIGMPGAPILPCGPSPAPATAAVTPNSATPPGARRSVTYSGRAMGTYVRVTLVTADSVASAPAAAAALAEFTHVDSLMSNWTTTSEVARINREAAAGPTRVQPEVATVIAAALRIGRASAGAFDITIEPLVRLWGFLGGKPHVPAEADVAAAFANVGARFLEYDDAAHTIRFAHPGVRIDLGGIAKGYAVDAASAALGARGVRDALVDISGNMFALGTPATADAWRIGIRDPRDRMPLFARLTLSARGISTSGKYEQFVSANGKTYGHILDPRTGRPADGLISVTVFAPTAMDADGWSTSLFVLGPTAARDTARARTDVDAVLVQAGTTGVDTVWVERTLKSRFVLDASAAALFHVEFF